MARMDLDDNPLKRLRAKDDVELDAPVLLVGSISTLFVSITALISFDDENAGSPVTTTFSNRGDVDVPTVVKSLVVVDFFKRSNGGAVDLNARVRSLSNSGHLLL